MHFKPIRVLIENKKTISSQYIAPVKIIYSKIFVNVCSQKTYLNPLIIAN